MPNLRSSSDQSPKPFPPHQHPCLELASRVSDAGTAMWLAAVQIKDLLTVQARRPLTKAELRRRDSLFASLDRQERKLAAYLSGEPLVSKAREMTKHEVEACYNTVAEGVTNLFAPSEAGGEHVSINPARLHLVALSKAEFLGAFA